jgi:hypothetical protein
MTLVQIILLMLNSNIEKTKKAIESARHLGLQETSKCQPVALGKVLASNFYEHCALIKKLAKLGEIKMDESHFETGVDVYERLLEEKINLQIKFGELMR